MLGRSDGTLNPSGVRFGSAEIYNLITSNFSDLIDDSLCVGMRRGNEPNETVVLFVKMEDDLELTPELIAQIRKTVRTQISPRHVPSIIEQCPEIPYTHNNKKVEIAVKQIVSRIHTEPIASIANAHCLDWYKTWAARQ